MDWKQFLDMNRYFALYRTIALVFLIVIGFNVGLIGLTGNDTLFSIFGGVLTRFIYILTGISAAFMCYAFYVEKYAKRIPPSKM